MNGKPITLNIGDWLHLLQIAVLFISLGFAWSRLDMAAAQVNHHTQQLDRIEHYLSSRDPNYWHTSEGYGLPPAQRPSEQ